MPNHKRGHKRIHIPIVEMVKHLVSKHSKFLPNFMQFIYERRKLKQINREMIYHKSYKS